MYKKDVDKKNKLKKAYKKRQLSLMHTRGLGVGKFLIPKGS